MSLKRHRDDGGAGGNAGDRRAGMKLDGKVLAGAGAAVAAAVVAGVVLLRPAPD
jgi:hypothetical protein